MVADRVRIIKELGTKTGSVPGDKIDDVARTDHIHRAATGSIHEIDHRKARTHVLVEVVCASAVHGHVQNPQRGVVRDIKVQHRRWNTWVRIPKSIRSGLAQRGRRRAHRYSFVVLDSHETAEA